MTELNYEPAESTSAVFGGNSNWRGPVWMPVNTLIVLTADWLASWLQKNKGVLRGLDYTFAGVFSIFAAKILLTQAR